jgi:hypothetical protein
VDSGILGLLSVVLLLVCIVSAASGLIRSRDPVWSPPALAVAGAAVAFLVLAFLFDVSSFPHTPYILMSLAGLLAVMRAQPVEHPRSAPRHFDGAGRKARLAVPAVRTDRRHSELSARR